MSIHSVESSKMAHGKGLVPHGTNLNVALRVLTKAELVADGFKIMFCVSPICPQPSVSLLYPKPVHRLDALLRRGPLGYRRGCICKGQYISWTLIGQLTFPTSPQRTQSGRRWREIRLWAIKLMKEGKDGNGRAEGKQD